MTAVGLFSCGVVLVCSRSVLLLPVGIVSGTPRVVLEVTQHGVLQNQAGLDKFRPKFATVKSDTEVFWQLPHQEEAPVGVLFIAHGCNHQASDLFSQRGNDGWEFPGCAASGLHRCLGLPEERRLVRMARQRGFLVVGVSGGSGVKSCWDLEGDPQRVKDALDHVLAEEKLPVNSLIYATGASSGGAFMGALARSRVLHGRLRCIAPQISPIETGGTAGVPTLFIHMAKHDPYTATVVQDNLAELRQLGVNASEIVANPLPVTSSLLERAMSAPDANAVLDAFRAGGLLDKDGFLLQDPRGSDWREVLIAKEKVPQGDSLIADESPLSELLNVAFARHEFTSQFGLEPLDFCASH